MMRFKVSEVNFEAANYKYQNLSETTQNGFFGNLVTFSFDLKIYFIDLEPYAKFLSCKPEAQLSFLFL